MLTDKLRGFYEAVDSAMTECGRNAGRIADLVMAVAFPETTQAAEREGADRMFRTGVISYIKRYLTKEDPGEDQRDFSEISPEFQPIVAKLHSHSHYVPDLGEYVPIGLLIDNPEWLDEARKYKRQKGMETLAEADALDELYAAVTKAGK